MKRFYVLAIVLGACGDGGGGDDGGDDGDDTPPPTTYGGDRPVELQLPAGYDETQEYPLVMVLHGYGATGLLQTAYLQLGDVATDPGAFFLAPEGTVDGSGRQFWAASDACCGDSRGDVDDVAYLGGVLDAVIADWPIDRSRVFLIGHSNGHFMSYRLACERADVVTGFAGLAGAAPTVDGAGCDPAQPVSALHVHGTADDVVEYAGGAFGGGSYPGAEESVELWAEKTGCATTRTQGAALDLVRDLAGAETTVELAEDCPDGVGVELWTITGGSHVPNFVDGFGTILTDWLQAHPRP